MKKKLMFVANWKMELNFGEEIDFASSNYDNFISLSEETAHQIVVCPSYLSLYTLVQMFKSTSLEFGAQDCSKHSRGAFTGQIPAESLNFVQSKYCIIGHSECRREMHETDDDIVKKLANLLDNRVSPILCIGESLEKYKEEKTLNVIKSQLEGVITYLKSTSDFSPYVCLNIAYEPIWAIGSGLVPEFDHLDTIFEWIYNLFNKENLALKTKLLYGGSVNSEIVTRFKEIGHLDGFLVGGASLDFQDFKKIVKS